MDKEGKTAEYWIEKLKLQKHPEGGYYREVYRSEEKISSKGLPKRYQKERSFSTSIYFLLKSDQCSKFHRLRSDEIWYYHAGDSVNVHMIDKEGNYSFKKLGANFEQGEEPQCIIPHGTWFGASIDNLFGYSLFGCAVNPGFDFGDFELGDKELLLERYPVHSLIIETLT